MNRPTRSRRFVAGGLCLCGLLLAAGCGGGKGVVSGKVLYQGKPVRGGTVSFVPEAGGVKSSPIEEDGSYTIRDVPTGTVTITVETESLRALAEIQSGPRGGPFRSGAPEFMKKKVREKDPKTADPEQAKRYVRIPKQYSDPAKSNLSYVVTSGKQEHNIELK